MITIMVIEFIKDFGFIGFFLFMFKIITDLCLYAEICYFLDNVEREDPPQIQHRIVLLLLRFYFFISTHYILIYILIWLYMYNPDF